MDIEVELYDGAFVKVSQEGLDRLLEHHLAKRFRRRSGWAVIGMHPIRSMPYFRCDYNGRERRHVDQRAVA